MGWFYHLDSFVSTRLLGKSLSTAAGTAHPASADQCSLLLWLNGWAVSYNCEKSHFNKSCIILALAHETCTRPTK